MKRLRNGARTEGEELLTRVLDECLEEDLSFVPHEREIAGKHRFSPGFEEQMEAMMTEAEQKMQEKELKKHFHFQWGQLAACVAVFCVCGALAGTVYLQHSGGKGTADTTAMMTAESADVAEESAELEVAEDVMRQILVRQMAWKQRRQQMWMFQRARHIVDRPFTWQRSRICRRHWKM